jgi:iron-sulfur cluster assembly accessory protein
MDDLPPICFPHPQNHPAMTLTDTARARLQALAAAHPETPFLRVAITAGGCSGLRQTFVLVAAPEAEDILLAAGTGGVLVDPVSAPFLDRAVLDWRDTLSGSTFDLRIPDAAARCGCGASFAPA